jgi:integrase
MPKLLLTDLTIRSLQAERHTDFWDTKTPAFGLRVGPRSKTFIGRIGAGRHTIGSYPDISLQDARRRFLALKSARPSAHRPVLFGQAYDDFKRVHCSQKKPRTQKDYLRMLDVHFLPIFRDRDLASITHQQVAKIADNLIKTPSECSHAIAVAHTFFKFCLRRHYIEMNPIEGIQLPKHTPRDRVLSDDELRAVWKATADGSRFSTIVRLLVLTGQRRGEISKIESTWIVSDAIVFPAAVTKNGKEHQLPVTPAILELAAAIRPFNCWMKCKLALDKKLGPDFKPWTLHDLRRTFATNMAKLGVRQEVTEKLLNHTTGKISGVAAIYNKHTYLDEMRAAVANWEKRLAEIVAPDPAQHPV